MEQMGPRQRPIQSKTCKTSPPLSETLGREDRTTAEGASRGNCTSRACPERPSRSWQVIGNFAAGPQQMAPGFVTDCRVEGEVRTVFFADGAVSQERLVAIEGNERRIVYAIVGGSLEPDHDNATMQVLSDGDGTSTLTWIHDVLPDTLADQLRDVMRDASPIIKAALEAFPNT